MSGTVGMPGPIVPYFATRNIVGTAFVAITPVFILTSYADLP